MSKSNQKTLLLLLVAALLLMVGFVLGRADSASNNDGCPPGNIRIATGCVGTGAIPSPLNDEEKQDVQDCPKGQIKIKGECKGANGVKTSE